MYQVKNEDGKLVCFDLSEIKNPIAKAFSRIMDYYARNFNDGKTQACKERCPSHIGQYGLNREDRLSDAQFEAKDPAPKRTSLSEGLYLFVTQTCPNCKIACAVLDKAGVSYKKLYANEAATLVREFEIRQAPTLVEIRNGEVNKFIGTAQIKIFLA